MDSQSVMEFDVAVLKGGKVPPVEVESLTVTEVNGQRAFIIKVRRDLAVSLRSYTVSYCFCEESVESVADASVFRRKTHSDSNINTERVMYFTGKLPPRLQIKGCGAYISEIVYGNGYVQSFRNTDYITPGAESDEDLPVADYDDGIEWAENADDYAALLSGSSEADYASTPFADTPVYDSFGGAESLGGTVNPGGADSLGGTGNLGRTGNSGRTGSSSPYGPPDDGPAGASSYGPPDSRRGSASPYGPPDGPADSGRPGRTGNAGRGGNAGRPENLGRTDGPGRADNPGNATAPRSTAGKRSRSGHRAVKIAAVAVITVCFALGVGFGLITYSKSGKASTVESLIDSGRYTEAYKIAESYESLRVDVARRAMKHYLETGDIKNAYIFGYLVGDASEVTDAALAKLESLGEEALGSDYFSVALKTEDKDRVDTAIDHLAESLAGEGKYEKAMNVTLFIDDDTRRSERSGSIFYSGISHYTEKGQYDAAAALIKRYGTTRSYDGAVDDSTVTEAIAYCVQGGDSASAVLLAKYFGRDYSGIDIVPGDVSIRDSIWAIYPLLTEAQRRAYHSNTLAYCKEAFQIKGGAIEGTDITDAAAVETYEFRTVVLHTDGRVTMLENGGHNETDEIPGDLRAVQVVTGLHHTVALRADGTCVAFGSNDYGQCNVSQWENIVKLAAGRYFTLGLCADGTVVACGSNLAGQCNVSEYRNVIDVAACDQTAVLMFADGTLRAQGDVTMGMYELSTFENVTALSCRANTAVVRFDDGTCRIICASEGSSAGDEAALTGAQSFCAGSTSVAYIDKDGKLQIIGDGAPHR